jgi:hypothetical protein
MPRRIIIDTDPGIDDAIAILLALAPPGALEVLGIVAVAGNLPLALTERNARRVCELAGRADIPVYAGWKQMQWLRAVASKCMPPSKRKLRMETPLSPGALPAARVAGAPLSCCAM